MLLIPAVFLSLAVQTPATPLLDRIRDATPAQARTIVTADPAAVASALDALLARVDASVHSDRKRPEQRRVSFDAEALALGVHVGERLAEATGHQTYLRRFRARERRLEGTVLLNDRKYREALVPLEAALTEARVLEDRWLEAITRISMAYGYLELGRGEEALAACEAAAELARALDQKAQALAVFNLGSVHLHLGDAAAGLRYASDALALARTVGNRLWEGNSLMNIGAAHRQLGDLEASHEAFEEALAVLEHTSDRLGVGRALYNMGLVASSRQRYADAAGYLERALPHIRTVDIRHSHEIELEPAHYQNPIEMAALQVLVDAYEKTGETARAAVHMAALKKLKEKQPRGGHSHRLEAFQLPFSLPAPSATGRPRREKSAGVTS